MLNISPIGFSQLDLYRLCSPAPTCLCPSGRNCSQEERDAFEKYDETAGIRKAMVAAMQVMSLENAKTAIFQTMASAGRVRRSRAHVFDWRADLL